MFVAGWSGVGQMGGTSSSQFGQMGAERQWSGEGGAGRLGGAPCSWSVGMDAGQMGGTSSSQFGQMGGERQWSGVGGVGQRVG